MSIIESEGQPVDLHVHPGQHLQERSGLLREPVPGQNAADLPYGLLGGHFRQLEARTNQTAECLDNVSDPWPSPEPLLQAESLGLCKFHPQSNTYLYRRPSLCKMKTDRKSLCSKESSSHAPSQTRSIWAGTIKPAQKSAWRNNTSSSSMINLCKLKNHLQIKQGRRKLRFRPFSTR